MQRWSRMDSRGDVICVLLIRARRRMSVPSEGNVVAGRARYVAVYDAGGSYAVDCSGLWWGLKDVEFARQNPVYHFQYKKNRSLSDVKGRTRNRCFY